MALVIETRRRLADVNGVTRVVEEVSTRAADRSPGRRGFERVEDYHRLGGTWTRWRRWLPAFGPDRLPA
jgi:hypothetical protein